MFVTDSKTVVRPASSRPFEVHMLVEDGHGCLDVIRFDDEFTSPSSAAEFGRAELARNPFAREAKVARRFRSTKPGGDDNFLMFEHLTR